jgi:hypothetical protein
MSELYTVPQLSCVALFQQHGVRQDFGKTLRQLLNERFHEKID